MKKLNLAIDVFYQSDKANVVGVLFDKWNQEEPDDIIQTLFDGVDDYQPGSFYKRELPCILKLIDMIELEDIDCIVVDGYVFLDRYGKKGLGSYLYEAINCKVPIIGVAKNYFHDTNATVLYRGNSKKPLYITSVGIENEEATQRISSMHGLYRFPTLLKLLDTETKNPQAFI